MSTKITSCEYIGHGRLTITSEALGNARYELGRKGNGMRIIPEGSFLDDWQCLKKLAPGVFEIVSIGWTGEHAQWLDHLRKALSYTMGIADILQVWEGGKSFNPFTGLRVNDGEVSKGLVHIYFSDPEPGKEDR